MLGYWTLQLRKWNGNTPPTEVIPWEIITVRWTMLNTSGTNIRYATVCWTVCTGPVPSWTQCLKDLCTDAQTLWEHLQSVAEAPSICNRSNTWSIMKPHTNTACRLIWAGYSKYSNEKTTALWRTGPVPPSKLFLWGIPSDHGGIMGWLHPSFLAARNC